jgi:hypothetical protein
MPAGASSIRASRRAMKNYHGMVACGFYSKEDAEFYVQCYEADPLSLKHEQLHVRH